MSIETKDREERKLKKSKISLMRNEKFISLSGVMMMGKTKIDDDVPTAYTNGRDEVYGRGILKWMDEKEINFVVVHEVMHKAKRDLTTWYPLFKIDARCANMACDYVNNSMILRSDPHGEIVKMPTKDGKPFGLIDRRFDGMNVKQVFDILRQEKKESGGGDGDGEGGGFDEHDWQAAQNMSEEEKEQLEKEIDRALRQGQIAASKVAGKGSDGIDRLIGDLLKPKIDWREVLREFISGVCMNKDNSTWRKVNRRFIGNDIFMPSLIGETVGRIVVGVDTSGSIGGALITRFLSEVKSIAENVMPEAIDLLYWDDAVAAHEQYDQGSLDNLVTSTKPKGGGGTDAACVPQYIRDKFLKPECVIMLTDGCLSSWGEYDVPVLWVIVGNDGASAPCGKTINVEEV